MIGIKLFRADSILLPVMHIILELLHFSLHFPDNFGVRASIGDDFYDIASPLFAHHIPSPPPLPHPCAAA